MAGDGWMKEKLYKAINTYKSEDIKSWWKAVLSKN